MEDQAMMNSHPPNNIGQGAEQPAYTIPGILNFIKHEWSRFEKERTNWEDEKAELKAKVAFLEGERRGQENLKRDLVRRIKMLEYALKQERTKLHKLQYGKELVFTDMKAPSFESEAVDPLSENNRNDSRRLLRDCLREIGYTDALLDVRASRIRHLRNPEPANSDGSAVANSASPERASMSPVMTNQIESNTGDAYQQPQSQVLAFAKQETVTAVEPMEKSPVTSSEEHVTPIDRPSSPPLHSTPADEESLIAEAQESLEKNFEFLEHEEESDSDSGSSADDESDEGSSSPSLSLRLALDPMETLVSLSTDSSGVEHDLDNETEDAILEFTTVPTNTESDEIEADISSESGPDAPPAYHVAMANQEAKEQEWGRGEFAKMQEKYTAHVKRKKKISSRPGRTEMERMKQYKNQEDEYPPILRKSPIESEPYSRPKSPKQATGRPQYEKIEVSLNLGELEWLSVANERGGGLEPPVGEIQKTWFGKYTMRSHFDGVTSVAFHPTEAILLTGSEDKTLKLWNLSRNGQTKRTAMIDVEPILTLRGHRASVLCVDMGPTGETCYSADELGDVRVWQLPLEISDPFDSYDPTIHQSMFNGHMDAVWDMAVCRARNLLLTCSSDGSCRMWDTKSNQQVAMYTSDTDYGTPTSVDFLHNNPYQLVVSYMSSRTVVFDTETGKQVIELNSALTSDNTPATQINKVRCHPTLPVAVTAHEDKYLRFFDVTSGVVTHSMVAHGDAVTGVAIDPNGLYLLSSSHDGSLRFWNMDSKICIQDTITHRKRFDEAIFNVACHSCKPFFASAGADGIAKVFV